MRATFLGSLGLCLTLLVAGCGSSIVASSTRKILPEFRATALEHKTLLLLPYLSTDVDSNGAYPVSQALMLEAAREYSGVPVEVAMPLRLTRVGATRATSSFKDRHQDVTVVTVPTERILAFQTEPENYLNVSVDGATRYRIPKVEALKTIGTSAQYVVVINGLRFSGETNYHRSAGFERVSREIRCKARFLVFGYTEGRVLAEGEVDASTGSKSEATLENLDTLMGYVFAEIVSKPPFL